MCVAFSIRRVTIHGCENDFLLWNGTTDDRELLHGYGGTSLSISESLASRERDNLRTRRCWYDKEIPMRIQTSVLRVSQVYIHRALVTGLANKRRRHRY